MTREPKADLLLHEGKVLGHPESDSIAVTGDRILTHGTFSDLKAAVGPQTKLFRLSGRTVAPGLIDSHLHFLEGAAAAGGLSLSSCRNLEGLLSDLKISAAKRPPGNWIRAFGCDEELLDERRGPTRDELDAVVPRNPLRLRHQTLHASWLNSRAITALKLEHHSFKPHPGALMMREASGRLSGLVVGMEQWITRNLPVVTNSELEARARLFSRELAAGGVTAFTDATVRNGPGEFRLFSRLVESGAICQRVGLMAGEEHLGALKDAAEIAAAGGFRLAGVKFMDPGREDRRTLRQRIALALDSGTDCAFHATELGEVDGTLKVCQAVLSARRGSRASRFRIEHAGVVSPDQIDEIRELGAWVVTNPGFIFYRGRKYAREPGLAPHLYRLRSLIDAGIDVAAATDSPVTPARPLAAVAAAATRQTLDQVELAPAERLDLAGGLALFTKEAARLAGLGAGEIEAGRLADLIVLAKDPLALEPAELANLPVDMTIVAGRVVYERGRPMAPSSARADLLSV